MGEASEKPVVRPADDETTVMQEISILLRDGRLDQGESVEDVASALRINKRYIEALEEGRFGDLPGPVYTLGFIRSFGEYVGLDGEELVRRFKAVSSTAVKRAELEFPEPIPESGIPGGVTLFAGLLVAALAYGGWYFMSERDNVLTDLVAPVPNELVNQTDGAAPGNETAPANRMAAAPEGGQTSDQATRAPYVAGSESAQGAATGATTVTEPPAEPSGEVAAEPLTGTVGGATDEAAGAAADESGTATANTAETTTTETADTATGQGAESTESAGSSTQTAQETTQKTTQKAAEAETQTGDQAQTTTTDATSAANAQTAAQTTVKAAPEPIPESTPEPAPEATTGTTPKVIPEPVAKPVAETAPVVEPAAEPAASASVDTSAEPAPETPSVTSSVTQTGTQEAQAETKSTTASETASTEDLNRQQLKTMQGTEGSSNDAEAGTSAQSSASSVQSSAQQASEQADQQTSEQAATSDTEQTAEQSTTEQAPAEQVADDTASSAPALSAEEVQASADAILLIAKEDAWVEVRNSITGDILLSRTLKKGQNFRVPANGQYVLQTGNAGGLRVVINGEVTPPIGKDGEILRHLALSSESLLKK